MVYCANTNNCYLHTYRDQCFAIYVLASNTKGLKQWPTSSNHLQASIVKSMRVITV